MNENQRIRRRIFSYVTVGGGLLLVYALLRTSSWQGNTQLHTLMEVAATLLALFVGTVALVRFYTRQNNTFLFIGTGFLGTALLDGYHAIVTSSFFDGGAITATSTPGQGATFTITLSKNPKEGGA